MSARSILLLVSLLPMIPLCFFRPFFGVIMWTIISFANPQSYAWGAQYDFQSGMLVAIPTLAGFALFSRGWQRLASREVVLLLILWGWFVITSMAAANTPLFQPHIVQTWDRLIFVSKIFVMTLASIGIIDSFERLRNLIIVIATCFGIFVAKALPFMVMTGGNYRLYGPERSMIEDNNDFGLALNMTLPLFFFLAQTETRPLMKRIWGCLFFVTIPAVFLTYSRGAMLGLVMIMFLMFLQLKQKAVLLPVIVAAALIAVIFAPEAWKERMDPTRDEAFDKSAQSRLNAWTFAFNLAMEYPVTGGGFKTFTSDLFARYAPDATDVKAPHSIYFGVLAEHGFVGLFLYVALLASCQFSVRRIAKQAAKVGDDLMANYARMLQFSMIGFMTSGFFLSRAYFDYYFTLLACVVALKHIWRKRRLEIAEAEGFEEETEDLHALHISGGAATC